MLRATWSARLEKLANEMFAEWESQQKGDPFARTCIVIGDLATRNWLQQWFLLKREQGLRKVLANVDFVLLPQFVNDWIAAVDGVPVGKRKSTEHPYAKNILAWRIYGILEDPKLGWGTDGLRPSFIPLQAYMGEDPLMQPKRRYALAGRIARLYDDYLASRPELLLAWERGEVAEGVEAWQGELYRLLTDEIPGSYAALYGRIADLAAEECAAAFDNGFPRYQSVHVFDVAFAPKVYLEFLNKLSDLLPVRFWNFTPSNGYWTDVEKKRHQPLTTPADERLLGSLATGGRAVLEWELDALEGDVEIADGQGEEQVPLPELEAIEVHSTYAPRRELETVRNGLIDFFTKHPEAKPSDALVLCADWATYAPLIGSTFGSHGASQGVPVTMESGIAEPSVLKSAFEVLLGFRDNRFEVSKVFALLETPAIARRIEVDDEAVSFLREIVKKANIHSGYEEPTPWCWRRGLDRLLVDALIGPRDDEESAVEVGDLPPMLPCGPIEGDRATCVAKLASFVDGLASLHGQLKCPHSPKEWSDILLSVVDGYFLPTDEDEGYELKAIRKAIQRVESDTVLGHGNERQVGGDVYLVAVLQGVKDIFMRIAATGDAVRIAPLNNGTATPAEFVWICGLSEGSFPRAGKREAFDLIGRKPTLFDVTDREKDTYALLKAVLGARKKLAFSYVGKSIRTNETIAAAVPLLDVMDWLGKVGRPLKRYAHPLQSYSAEYFRRGSMQPANYSRQDYAAASALLGRSSPDDPQDEGIAAFVFAPEGETTVLALSDILEFLAKPNCFVIERRLKARQYSDFGVEMDDEGPFEMKLTKTQARRLKFDPPESARQENLSFAAVESGSAPNIVMAREGYRHAISGANALDRRKLLFQDENKHTVEDVVNEDVVREALKKQGAVDLAVESEHDGHRILVKGTVSAYEKDGVWYHLETEFKSDAGYVVESLLWRLAKGTDFVNVAVHDNETTTLRAVAPMGADFAKEKLGQLLSLCFDPLPKGMPDATVEFTADGETLAEALQPLLENVAWWKSCNLRKA